MKYWFYFSLLLTTGIYADDSDSSDSELEDFQPGQTRKLLQERTGRPTIDQKTYDQNMIAARLLAHEMALGEKFVTQVRNDLLSAR